MFPKEPTWSKTELFNIKQSIESLLIKGAIRRCSPCADQFVSNVFLTPKPDGTYRMILNLKNLNKFITCPHFKMENYRTVSNLITKNAFLAKIDLKDAYFLIPIHPDYTKFLRFSFQNQLYEYTVLPFGLNTSPFVFTKILKPVISFLRSLGFLSVIYIDDFLLMGNSYLNCLDNVNRTSRLLENLGFIINKEKSILIPSQKCTFLGLTIDSVKLKLSVPEDKAQKILKIITSFHVGKICSIRDFAKLIGTLVAICPAVKYGWLFTKAFERFKFLSLQLSKNNYENKITIPPSLKNDLFW